VVKKLHVILYFFMLYIFDTVGKIDIWLSEFEIEIFLQYILFSMKQLNITYWVIYCFECDFAIYGVNPKAFLIYFIIEHFVHRVKNGRFQ